jgi:hypothetical protein
VAGTLTIGRVSLSGLAPVTLAHRDRFARLFAAVDERRLSSAIARRLGDSDSPRVLVLDRLNVEIEGMAGLDPDGLSDRLAEAIVAAVARLDGGGFARSCIFDSPAHRLAAYALALCRGEAGERWWFSDFAPHAALPRSSAIRSVLQPAPLQALATLAEPDRTTLAMALSTVDAGLLLDAIIDTLADDPVAAELAEALEWVPPSDDLGPAATVILGLAALQDRSGLAPSRRAVAGLRLARAARRFASGPGASDPAVRARLCQGIVYGDVGVLNRLMADISIEEAALLLSSPPAIRELFADRIARSGGPAVAQGCSVFSPFGGMLIVWPHLAPIESQVLPEGPGDPRGIAALLGLSALAGRRRSADALRDEALCLALGVDPAASLAGLAEWLAATPAGAVTATAGRRKHDAGLPEAFRTSRTRYRALMAWSLAGLARFARGLPGFADASLPFLRHNLLSSGAQVTVHEAGVKVRFERPSLDVVLAISGLAERAFDRPDGVPVVFGRRR